MPLKWLIPRRTRPVRPALSTNDAVLLALRASPGPRRVSDLDGLLETWRVTHARPTNPEVAAWLTALAGCERSSVDVFLEAASLLRYSGERPLDRNDANAVVDALWRFRRDGDDPGPRR